jgi:hypothetical protein
MCEENEITHLYLALPSEDDVIEQKVRVKRRYRKLDKRLKKLIASFKSEAEDYFLELGNPEAGYICLAKVEAIVEARKMLEVELKEKL